MDCFSVGKNFHTKEEMPMRIKAGIMVYNAQCVCVCVRRVISHVACQNLIIIEHSLNPVGQSKYFSSQEDDRRMMMRAE